MNYCLKVWASSFSTHCCILFATRSPKSSTSLGCEADSQWVWQRAAGEGVPWRYKVFWGSVLVRKTRDDQVQGQLKRGRNNSISPGKTLIIRTLTMLIMITIRICTYSFNTCVLLCFYRVVDTVLCVPDRAINKRGKVHALKDTGRQGKEVNVW